MLKNKLKFHSKFVNVNLVIRLLCGSAFIRVCGCSHHGATVIRCHIPMHHLYYFLMGIVFILSILGLMKSCIGLYCSPNVEIWGLETFMNCGCDFCEGDCFTKTRRKFFFLNLIFFFICPFLFVYYACQNITNNKCRNKCYNNDWIITAKDKTITTIKNNRANVKACCTPSTDEEVEDVEYIKQMLQCDEIDSSNYWIFCEEKFISLERPVLLDARDFQVIYPNAEEVGYANELSVMPKYFCVNNPVL